MKTTIRNTVFAATTLLIIAASSAMADGRDSSMPSNPNASGYSAFGTNGNGTSGNFQLSNNSRWLDKGYGGWRTQDRWGNIVQADKGFNIYDVGFDLCRLSCEVNGSCKGVEFISTPGGWFERGLGYSVIDKCEIHYDAFAHCDTNGGGSGYLDGCWVKKY